ncbi:Hypothetical protein NTJ_02605 [Nesidiocoris tenuis]|uniref:Uncharacterized protein n=1 Tax=Nesidiocoris tenuis TaxID=355587 RepID=A0ABN7ACU6_9HEMI|nr:Hypothetical protein NTJ_02605 [Nesidiocoris tenuis]
MYSQIGLHCSPLFQSRERRTKLFLHFVNFVLVGFLSVENFIPIHRLNNEEESPCNILKEEEQEEALFRSFSHKATSYVSPSI